MRLRALVFAATLLAPAVAHADLVTFFFTPANGSSLTVTFDTNSPSAVYDDFAVVYHPLTTTTGELTAVAVFSIPALDLDIGDLEGAHFDNYYSGPQLYTGSESNPKFLDGTYNLTPSSYGTGSSLGDATLVITSVPSPIPEPSSFALLGTGVLGFAGVVRRRLSRR